jgi:dynein heavy chain 1
MGKTITVHPDVGIFITMNPGYAGRSNLPDNLKKLFRNLAMTQPDRQLIAQVMLFSQGFRSAEMLARKIVPLFILCKEQLSAQSHYDFGLRSLKAVLVTAGNIKRERLEEVRKEFEARGSFCFDRVIEALLFFLIAFFNCILIAVFDTPGEALDDAKVAAAIDEQEVVIQSVSQSMVPKLVADDIPLLRR